MGRSVHTQSTSNKMIKEFVIVITLGAISLINKIETSSSVIQKATPQTAFRKIGQLIPNLGFGNIKFHINTTELVLNGTVELCHAAQVIRTQTKSLKTSSRQHETRMIMQIAHDLEMNCKENWEIIKDTQEMFGVKKLDLDYIFEEPYKHIVEKGK